MIDMRSNMTLSCRSLMLAALIAAPLHDHLLAQPVCETVRNEQDEFTGSHVLQITSSDHSNGPHFDWFVKDSLMCVRMHWQRMGEAPAIVFEGDTLMLKLENDTVLILTSVETTVGNIIEGMEPSSRAIFSYLVDEEQLAYISHYWVQKVRIYFRDGHQEFHAVNDPTWQMGFWKSSNCLLQTMRLKPVPDIVSGFGESRH
jgi:hypothetical protein